MIKIIITINNEEKNINILNDYLFSKLFGERGCERETLHIINTITEKKFTSLSYEPNEMKGRHKGHKKSNVDVLVIMNEGTVVNIESQIKKQKDFHKRSHFYSSKIFSIFLSVGQNYEKLPMGITINILGFDLHETENYHSSLVLCDKKSKNYKIEDILESHYIQLPKFRKAVQKGKIDLNDPEVRLILLMDIKTPQELIEKVIKMDKFANDIYEKTLHVLQNQKEYLSYIRAEQAEIDYKAQIEYAEEKGEEKGIEKGEHKKAIEVATQLKNLDLPIEKIAEITGLPIKKIKEL